MATDDANSSGWLHTQWDRLRSTFWFLPSLMALAAALLALGSVALDRGLKDDWRENLSWAYTGGAEGASQVLGTIAGSMITLAGVVFSMTLVALSLASSQLGPRLLRNFMRDTTNQVVIGTFVATFVYCLLVLRTVRRADELLFVPHVSVTLGVVLALASLALLIYFVHHVAVSLQADHVIARVAITLSDGIERLFPNHVGQQSRGARPAATRLDCTSAFEGEGRRIAARDEGYLQMVNARMLMELAAETDTYIRLAVRPGHYIGCGRLLATVFPLARADDKLDKRLRSVFVLGEQRTDAQDVEFGFLQLVEVAVRALSPGINDPFTAMSCIDRLGSALTMLALRETPAPFRSDAAGVVRVEALGVNFTSILASCVDPLRHHASGDALVTGRLLDTLAAIAPVARLDERNAIQHHADTILRGSLRSLQDDDQRLAVTRLHRGVADALRHPHAHGHRHANVS